MPCSVQKRAPARSRAKRQQTLRHHFEAQHADHLAGFGHHPHAPFADGLFGEVLLVGPGPITGLSAAADIEGDTVRSEEHTSELQSRENLVCRLLLEKK